MNDNLEMNIRPGEAETSIAFYEFNDEYRPTEDSLSKREIGRSFYQLGKLHYDKSDLDAAEENFLKSLKCAERPRDIFSIFKILGFLIRISSERKSSFGKATFTLFLSAIELPKQSCN